MIPKISYNTNISNADYTKKSERVNFTGKEEGRKIFLEGLSVATDSLLEHGSFTRWKVFKTRLLSALRNAEKEGFTSEDAEQILNGFEAYI